MSFLRYNTSTNKFEQSVDSGANWTALFTRQNYAPTLGSDNSSTLTSISSAASYVAIGDMIHVEVEIQFTVATADANSITASLPVAANSTRSTAANFRAWKAGVGAAGYAVSVIPASASVITIYMGDSSVWTNGVTYSCWFQITYFR